MIDHLDKVLTEVKGVEVVRHPLQAFSAPPECHYTVFCGYDHLTLAHLHLTLSLGRTATMYDEPGRSLESELNNILFRGVDARRIPASSLDALQYSWSFRDIVALVKSNALKLPSEPKSNKPVTRTRSRANSPRQVENSGTASPREGDVVVGEESRGE
jgi:hypothetical protein